MPWVMSERRMTLAEAIATAGVNQTIAPIPPGFSCCIPALFHLDSQTADALILADRFALEPHYNSYVDAAPVILRNRVI